MGTELVQSLPVDMYFSLTFPHVEFNQSVWVGMTAEAVEHLRRTLKTHVVLTWDDLMAVYRGCMDAADPAQRQTRLLEALNYFAEAQGIIGLVKYA